MNAWVMQGGGAGFVQALLLICQHLKAGYPMPDFMVGTSAGGILAYCISYVGIDRTIEILLEITKRSDLFSGHLFLGGWWHLGIWHSGPLQELMERVKEEGDRVAKIPFWTCSYDIKHRRKLYFSHHYKTKYHVATACIPFLVDGIEYPTTVRDPVTGEIKKTTGLLVDGGLVENTPLKKAIDQGADIIDVFMCFAPETARVWDLKNKWDWILPLIEAMRFEIAGDDTAQALNYNMIPGKRVIEVRFHYPATNELGVLDFHRMKEWKVRLYDARRD